MRNQIVFSLLMLCTLGSASAMAATVTLQCTSSSYPPEYLTFDLTNSTVTDRYGTWPAQITDSQVTWTTAHFEGLPFPRTNSYDRNAALFRSSAYQGELHCEKAAPPPF